MVRCAMLKDTIRTIPDYPKPGIQFRDITTVLTRASVHGDVSSATA